MLMRDNPDFLRDGQTGFFRDSELSRGPPFTLGVSYQKLIACRTQPLQNEILLKSSSNTSSPFDPTIWLDHLATTSLIKTQLAGVLHYHRRNIISQYIQ